MMVAEGSARSSEFCVPSAECEEMNEGMMMADQAVIAALEAEVECYQRLAKLAEVQHEHVQENRTELLLDVLGQRQEVLSRIVELERVAAPARKQWNAFLDELDAAQRERIEWLVAETRRLLEKITAADRNDTLVLQQRKLNLGKQIGQAAAGRQVNRSYATAAYGAPRGRVEIRR